MRRVLLVSWCSFDEVVATVGDARAVEVVSGWLRDAGIDHDVAWAAYLGRGPDAGTVDPTRYTDAVFACGPLLQAPVLTRWLDRFDHCRRVAVGVSVVDPAVAARFDVVLARDDGTGSRPDLAAATPAPTAAVAAGVLAPEQKEYRERVRHTAVRAVVARWLATRGLGWFEVATDLWTPERTARSAEQVTAALARADVVVSSRLHGLVLGLAAGRPVLAVDPVAGGAKVTAQAAALGWPVVLDGDRLDEAALDGAWARCTAATAADEARATAVRAGVAVAATRDEVLTVLRGLARDGA